MTEPRQCQSYPGRNGAIIWDVVLACANRNCEYHHGDGPVFGTDWTCPAHGAACPKSGLDWDCTIDHSAGGGI